MTKNKKQILEENDLTDILPELLIEFEKMKFQIKKTKLINKNKFIKDLKSNLHFYKKYNFKKI